MQDSDQWKETETNANLATLTTNVSNGKCTVEHKSKTENAKISLRVRLGQITRELNQTLDSRDLVLE